MKDYKIAVIGAGTMGRGIAQVFATSGFDTTLIDSDASSILIAKQEIEISLDKLIKKGIITETKYDIESRLNFEFQIDSKIESCDLVIEAVSEHLDIKKDVFKTLDKLCKPSTILASNTSSISITLLGSITERSSSVIGMHFMNPVPLKELVEVIPGLLTSQKTIDTINQLAQLVGKSSVVAKDYPGFVANRILMPMINEAIGTLNDGVASVQDIDKIMKLGMAHPMGPLELADYIGLDVCLSILKIMHKELGNDKYAPSPLLVKMVEAKLLGVKSKSGFYNYDESHKKPNSLFR